MYNKMNCVVFDSSLEIFLNFMFTYLLYVMPKAYCNMETVICYKYKKQTYSIMCGLDISLWGIHEDKTPLNK